jgi:transcriptional regulator with XRE-family HTH domain
MHTASSANAMPHDQHFSDFSAALRYWRRKRGYSQLQLSTMGAVSQRHLSFVESGRAQPSRELILKLGIALEIPLRQRNIMLLSAGFAPAYRERKLADPELAAVRQALDFMLAQQAPYPALVVDRLWNLQLSNEPAAVLVRWLLDLPDGQALPGNGAANVIRLMLDSNGVRRFLVNWKEVGADLLHWLQREAMSDGPGSEAGKLLAELAALAGGDLHVEAGSPERHALPFLPVTFRKDGVELRLFTTIATLGTPRDVTLHELRIESFFPADEATAQWFHARGDSARRRAPGSGLPTQER